MNNCRSKPLNSFLSRTLSLFSLHSILTILLLLLAVSRSWCESSWLHSLFAPFPPTRRVYKISMKPSFCKFVDKRSRENWEKFAITHHIALNFCLRLCFWFHWFSGFRFVCWFFFIVLAYQAWRDFVPFFPKWIRDFLIVIISFCLYRSHCRIIGLSSK